MRAVVTVALALPLSGRGRLLHEARQPDGSRSPPRSPHPLPSGPMRSHPRGRQNDACLRPLRPRARVSGRPALRGSLGAPESWARAVGRGARSRSTRSRDAHGRRVASPRRHDLIFGSEFFYDSFPPDTVLSMGSGLGFATIIGEFMNEPAGGRDKGSFAIVAAKR